MSNRSPSYFSYLLRLWPITIQGQLMWRASLEHPHTGERMGFASLERLFAFLQDQTRLSGDETEWPSFPNKQGESHEKVAISSPPTSI